MKKSKIIYIISDIEKSLSFEWTARELSQKYDLLFLLIGKEGTELAQFLNTIHCKHIVVSDSETPSNIKKWIKIFWIIKREKPDVVHVHLWRAMLFGLTTSWILRVKKRVLTRHYSTLQYNVYPTGVKWDKLGNWLATDIIAISETVKKVLIEYDKADENKIQIIHHGFDMKYFNQKNDLLVKTVCVKYDINIEKKPIIGVIARYLELKGIHYIIIAFKKLRDKYPDAQLILANTTGNYSSEIRRLLNQLPDNSYTEIFFESDLSSLYLLFDVFIHAPVDRLAEAFGQTYVEALAMGVPSVFTLSGIAPEFIRSEDNALVVDHRNSENITVAIERILQDESLRSKLIKSGKLSVQQFSLDKMIDKLESLYTRQPIR